MAARTWRSSTWGVKMHRQGCCADRNAPQTVMLRRGGGASLTTVARTTQHAELLEKKRNELYAKYASDGLLASEAEAKSMLHVGGAEGPGAAGDSKKRQRR